MQRKHLPAATFDVPASGPISATETCRSALLSNYSGHLFFDVTARWRALLIISKTGADSALAVLISMPQGASTRLGSILLLRIHAAAG